MGQRRSCPRRFKTGRAKMMALAILTGAVAVGGVVSPDPALAWWRNGVWVPGPPPGYPPPPPGYGPGYPPPPGSYPPPQPGYGPGYAPPVVVVPPSVFYAPPPPVYSPMPPPPPSVYYPPPGSKPDDSLAHACFTPAVTCPLNVARATGSTCYCSDPAGDLSYGIAQ